MQGEEAALTLKHYILRDIRMKGSFMAAQSDCQEVLDKVVQHNIKVENNIFHGLDAVSRIVKMLQNAEYRGKATIVVDEETYKDDQANKRV